MAKAKTSFVCQNCGLVSGKWLGRCSECGEWNSLVEEVALKTQPAGTLSIGVSHAMPIGDVRLEELPRKGSGISEFDRVLGGGLVPGSLVLLGGEPGIGKSTLLLQAMNGFAESGAKVLYVSGEESVAQTAMRAERLNVRSKNLLILAETELERILDEAARVKPAVLVIDSVQTMHSGALESIPGSLSQVREVAGRMLSFAKTSHTPVIIVGHVTKDGGIAGPKTLEHVVDTVLYFEGDQAGHHRLLRANKNRFGSTNELGVFEMRDIGLAEVLNPSALFLAERATGAPGSAVVAALEGSRPLLVEIQALVARSAGMPRRTALGVDPNRISLLLAVLERRAGIDILGSDVFVNVAGGLRLTEPAVDLGVVAAIASSIRSRPLDPLTVCIGEVGLAGEIRAVHRAEQRVVEAKKLGFKRILLPEASRKSLGNVRDVELVGVRDVSAALSLLIE